MSVQSKDEEKLVFIVQEVIGEDGGGISPINQIVMT